MQAAHAKHAKAATVASRRAFGPFISRGRYSITAAQESIRVALTGGLSATVATFVTPPATAVPPVPVCTTSWKLLPVVFTKPVCCP